MPIEDSDPKERAREKRRAKRTERQTDAQAPFAGFVDFVWEEKDKNDWKEWLAQDGLFDSGLTDALGEGFKFTLQFDRGGDCFRATTACWLGGVPGAGRVLSARASTPTDALTRVVWLLVWRLNYDLGSNDGLSKPRDLW